MTFDKFKKEFRIKGSKCSKSGKDVWTVTEKNGNYFASGLTEHAVLWELNRLYKSRQLELLKKCYNFNCFN